MELIRRRILKPDRIGFYDKDFFVETRFYQYSKRSVYAMGFLILCIVTVFFLFSFFEKTYSAVILVVLLFAIPVYSAVSGKTWFSFSVFDPRVLRLERNGIQIGDEFFRIQDIEFVKIYVHSFYGLRCNFDRIGYDFADGSEYGDKNEIRFKGSGRDYKCRFILRNGVAYITLYKLMEYWKARGVQVYLKEEFSYDFVMKQVDDPVKRV